MSLDSGERNEAAKKRREDQAPVVLEQWERMDRENSLARYYLGFVPEAATVYLHGGPKGRQLWIRDELLVSPCLKHADARFPKDFLTTRFEIGPWDEPGYTVRCSFVEDKGHCIALPTYPEADRFLVIYRHRSYEEWANEPGYRNFHMGEDDEGDERPGAAMVARLTTEGWEARHDPRTGDVWARRKMEGATAQAVMGQQ